METLDYSSEDLQGPVALLELENAFLAQLLQRVWPAGLARSAATAATADDDVADDDDAPADEIGREPLLLAEKQELCAVEAGAVRREIEALAAAGELERACAAAAAADCRTHQAAEVGRGVAALLGLLEFPQPDTATAAAMAAASAAALPAAEQAAASAATALAVGQPNSAGSASSPPSLPPTRTAHLPTAKQLARAQLDGGQIGRLLDELLERQSVAAERLRTRAGMLQARAPLGGWYAVWRRGMAAVAGGSGAAGGRGLAGSRVGCTRLERHGSPAPLLLVLMPSSNPSRVPLPTPAQVQLGKAEAQLAQRAEQGAAFSRVDFEQLRIEHSQASRAGCVWRAAQAVVQGGGLL